MRRRPSRHPPRTRRWYRSVFRGPRRPRRRAVRRRLGRSFVSPRNVIPSPPAPPPRLHRCVPRSCKFARAFGAAKGSSGGVLVRWRWAEASLKCQRFCPLPRYQRDSYEFNASPGTGSFLQPVIVHTSIVKYKLIEDIRTNSDGPIKCTCV
jgi:hypothetical protein